ncbi:MAG: TonB-dependent receptor [Gemmatimonadaceae bacterium]
MAWVALGASHAVQAQSATAEIAGVVQDAAAHPLAQVTVDAVNVANGFRSRVLSDTLGRFRFLGLAIGGPYRLVAQRAGYADAEMGPIALPLGAHPQVTLVLRAVSQSLPARVVRDRIPDGRDERVGGSTRIDRATLQALPVADRNFTSLAALSPLAGPQLALGGMRWTGTDLRIDGLGARNQLRAGEVNAGPSAIPLEAIREVEVNTAVFDASQGRQSGGQIAAVTRTGTNDLEAIWVTSARNTAWSAPQDYQGRPRSARTAHLLQSAWTLGGPIRRDRAHYFLAYERQDAQQPLLTGDVATTAAELATGIARDSLERILRLLAQRYGLTDPASQLGRLDRQPRAQTLFARVDWQSSPQQQFTARLLVSDWNSPLSGGVDQPIALREARAGLVSREAQLAASWRTQWAGRGVHEVQFAAGTSRRSLLPESPGIPRGFVQVRSALPDGTMGNATVQFGGNRLAPDDSREWQLQLTNRLSVPVGPLVLRIGTDNAWTGTRTLIAESQSGLFVFPSIAALEAGTPNRFTRTVPLSGASPVTQQQVLEVGAYAQAEWAWSPHWELMAGMRWDGTVFGTAPPTRADVDAAFGVHTGRAPRDLAQWQPRAELVWRSDAEARDVVRIGVGRFAASLPYYVQHNALLYTGALLADVDVRGAAVPTPDYLRYRQDPSTVPGLSVMSTTPPPYLNVTGAVRAPRTTVMAVAWSHRVAPTVTLTVGAQGARVTDNYHYVDRNLRTTPAFRLAAEAARAVWVPAATIPVATGVTDVRAAAQQPAYARVLSLESGARADRVHLTAELTVHPQRGVRGMVGYAWGRARDNSSFGCCLARTATTFTPVVDDPRDLTQAWGPSDGDIRHRVVSSVEIEGPWGVRIAARYRGSSGRPFSLVVDGDINGDEANGNDRAFLFNPDDPSTPADVAASMRRLLATPGNLAAPYIRAHVGEIAGRNSVYTPWSHRVDARLARRLAARGALAHAELQLDLFNVGHLLNPRWGAEAQLPTGISAQNPVVNRVPLLRVVGFDPVAQRYRYTVNEGAGVLPKGGDPWQLQIGVQVSR